MSTISNDNWTEWLSLQSRPNWEITSLQFSFKLLELKHNLCSIQDLAYESQNQRIRATVSARLKRKRPLFYWVRYNNQAVQRERE